MQPNHNQRSKQGQSVLEILGSNNMYGRSRRDIPKPGKADILVPNYIPRAVYPVISTDAFYRTMDNFRIYIDEYNIATGWENVDIDNHNILVDFYLRNKATEIQKQYAKHFPKLNESLTKDREYNLAVDRAVEEHGPIIKKRRIQEVKYPTEQLFVNMLHVYNNQLMRRNEEFIKLHNTTPRPLEPLTINSLFISSLQRTKGIQSLDICHKTVRNHRMRLEEAGVFVNYTFKGWQRGVEVHINPEILVFFDAHPNKLTGVENQPFTLWKGKKVLDINQITCSSKEEYKEENDATQSFDDKVSALPTAFKITGKHFIHEGTGRKEENQTEGAAAESVKIEKTKSEKLRDLIIHPQELAENLANKDYNHYKPIDIRFLHAEAMNGKLTDSEFRELIIQDLFKTSAKIWTETTPWVGSWKKAINHWMENKFLNYRGYALGKERLIDYVEEYRYRLTIARMWFVKNEWKALYPSEYFDTRRQTSKEMGFEYTKKSWTRHKQYLESKKSRDLKEDRKAAIRLRKLTDEGKFRDKIKSFLNQRITITKLVDYVAHNLPPDYMDQLQPTIQKMMEEPVTTRRKLKTLKL